MSWTEHKLGELIEIKHGYAFKSQYFSDSGKYLLLTPGNCYESGGLKLKGDKEKYFIGDIPKEFILKRGDLLIVMTDLVQVAPILGGAFITPADNRFLHNQRLGLVTIRNRNELNKLFLYYLLNTEYYRAQVRGSASGATVRHTAPERIYNCNVKIPTLSKQQKIATILGAYDDLIENNTRRIQILEEMAQALYREWFVKFRFPGPENVKRVESELGLVPEGWKVRELGDIANINASTIKKGNEPEEIRYIDIASVSTGKIDKIEPLVFADAPSRARRMVKHGDIIWSTVRPNRKSYSIILSPPPNLIVSTGFAVITAKYVPYTYLYHALTTDDFVGYLTNHATGAAYPAVNSGDFKSALVMLPTKSLLELFHKIVIDLFDHKQNMHQKNANLCRTRDLLLPKLISGEVEVGS